MGRSRDISRDTCTRSLQSGELVLTVIHVQSVGVRRRIPLHLVERKKMVNGPSSSTETNHCSISSTTSSLREAGIAVRPKVWKPQVVQTLHPTSNRYMDDVGSLGALFPLTWPIPSPTTHKHLLQLSDLSREEDLQRNAGSFRHWWTAITSTKDAIVAQQKKANPASPYVDKTLGMLSTPEARLGLQKLVYLYESALACFPTSFKLWKAYLQMRCLYVLGKSTKPKRAGGRKKLAEMREALEDELETAETWDSGLDGVIGWEEWKALVATFERAITWLPTMPRLWLMYFTLFQHPQCPAQLSHTHARRTFDRALRTLPPSLHSRIWTIYLLWSEAKGGSTTARVYRRYLAIDPSITERYAAILLSPDNPQPRPLEAAKLLLGLARKAAKGKYVSPEGKSPYQLLGEWLDVVQQYSEDVGMDLKEASSDLPSSSRVKEGERGEQSSKQLLAQKGKMGPLMRMAAPPQPVEEKESYDEEVDPTSSRKMNVEKIVREDGLEVYKDQAGRLWAGLATYWSKRGEFDKAKETFESGISSVLTVRDFTQVFDAYTEFLESLNTALMSALESPEDEETAAEIEADLDVQMQAFEALIDRRPFLVNDVLLRRNPHDVQEWEKRIALWGDNDEKVAETYTRALETISPKKSSANFHRLYINFAKFYEEGGTTGQSEPDLASARKLLEKATKVNFRLVDELAEVWIEWAELEIRRDNYDEAIRVMQRAAYVPKDSKINYHDQSLPVQARLFKSLKLWSFYVDLEESIGTVETTKNVYDKILELRIANAQIIVNYATFLEDNQYFEESFKVYERGVELFNYPISFEIWNIYLSKFVKRYGGSKLERTRDLFEQALEKCPQKSCKPLFLMYAKLEEDFGLAKRAMAIYERAVGVVADQDKFEMFTIYIAKVTENYGLPATRPIFERALEVLPDKQTARMCLRFASMERKLGEIDRARAIYAHASQFCDPRLYPDFWKEWNQFEVETGSEDTFKEYLRIKRSVQSQYNTEASFLTAHALGGQKDAQATSAPAPGDAMAEAEKQATKGPSFVRATTTVSKPVETNGDHEMDEDAPNTGDGNDEEIRMSDDEE
ncbi:pre-mRNA-splicing factor syf1 [Serendipita sp. 398]|nr:pre-mRNA-splicing factor syf1 [Serendipita sp. 398]